jgi:hypothetical protein
MITPLFTATITKGKVIFYNVDLFNSYLRSLEGKDVHVSVKVKKKIRSLNQNSFYWGVCIPILCDITGYTEEEIHEAMKIKFLMDNTRSIPTVKSTASLSTVEFEDYIEKIRQWAAQDLSCVIPDPNQVEV